MTIEVHLTNHDIERIAARLAELLGPRDQQAGTWLDVVGAATHLGSTENAVRGLVKRRQIPFRRTPNGRLRFAVTELDEWVRTGSCESPDEDLP
jgi:hypothetical protein